LKRAVVTGLRTEDGQPADKPEEPVGRAGDREVDAVQEADEESFPASDPPAQWSGPGGG
jgi:hypothetical protein